MAGEWVPGRYEARELPRVLWPCASTEPLFLLRRAVPWALARGRMRRGEVVDRVARAKDFTIHSVLDRGEIEAIAADLGFEIGVGEPLSALSERVWGLSGEGRKRLRARSRMWGVKEIDAWEVLGGLSGGARLVAIGKVAEYARDLIAGRAKAEPPP